MKTLEQRWARKDVARFKEGAVVDGRGGGFKRLRDKERWTGKKLDMLRKGKESVCKGIKFRGKEEKEAVRYFTLI